MADTTTTTDFVFYHYKPSLIAAAIFCVLFTLSTILHFYQLLRTRTMYMIPMLIGCLCEFIGYVGRIISSTESPNYSLAPYILQALLLLVAPALLAATIYMILGYIILAVDAEHHSMIQKKFLTKIFVIGDLFSFMIQSTGASILTKKETNAKTTGTWIIVGGLAIQLLFFGWFIILSVVFYVRLHRHPTPLSQSRSESSIPWRKHTLVLFAASTVIMIRSIFRVVEYVQGNDGYLLRNEIWLYVFDAALMFSVVAVLNVVHPSQITGLVTGRAGLYYMLRLEATRKASQSSDLGKGREHNPRGYEMETGV